MVLFVDLRKEIECRETFDGVHWPFVVIQFSFKIDDTFIVVAFAGLKTDPEWYWC